MVFVYLLRIYLILAVLLIGIKSLAFNHCSDQTSACDHPKFDELRTASVQGCWIVSKYFDRSGVDDICINLFEQPVNLVDRFYCAGVSVDNRRDSAVSSLPLSA